MPLFPLPRANELARAYYQEAARHLEDAWILHQAQRYAGSITSSMKAVELGVKSVLILNGASGWLDDILRTHDILKGIEGHPNITLSFLDALGRHDSTLQSDIKLLEALVPVKQDVKKLEYEVAANTEYPFFAFKSGSPPSASLQLYAPGSHFVSSDSEKHFRTARRLLEALKKLEPEIKRWKVPLCADV